MPRVEIHVESDLTISWDEAGLHLQQTIEDPIVSNVKLVDWFIPKFDLYALTRIHGVHTTITREAYNALMDIKRRQKDAKDKG